MNSDNVRLHEMIPVGRVVDGSTRTLLPLHTECGNLTDPETGDRIYTLHQDIATGLPFVIHIPTGNRWFPSWRSLVSRAEREGIRELAPTKRVEVDPETN